MRTRTSFARASLLATVTVTMAAAVTGVVMAPGARADNGGEERRTQGYGSSAYGLSLTGPIPVQPLPSVWSASSEVRRSVLKENSTRLLSAKALESGAAAGRADATVSDLRIPALELMAEAITAKCGMGGASSRLVNARLAGQPLESAPRPNTTVPVKLPGLGPAWVTLNKQERLRDGRLSVTGMETSIPLGPLGRETVRTANAVCGHGKWAHDHPWEATEQDSSSGESAAGGPAHGQQPAAPAPKPSPVRGDLAVTG